MTNNKKAVFCAIVIVLHWPFHLIQNIKNKVKHMTWLAGQADWWQMVGGCLIRSWLAVGWSA